MDDFLRFVNDVRHMMALHVEITYSKTCDWMIYIYRRGCADEYPKGAPCDGEDAIMCHVQDSDMELCFAKAHVALKEWLLEYNSGY